MRPFLTALLALVLVTSQAGAKDTTVVVIDASGSMNDPDKVKGGKMSRMNVAKEALKRVLPNIKGDVDLGIVVFSARNLSKENDGEWVYPVGPIVRESVLAAIDKPEASGGTPLGDYIKVGADRLLDRRKKSGNSGRFRLVIVTDGENNEGIDPIAALQDVKRKGIEVSVIGFAVQGEHSLAKIVTAMPTPGTYQSAQDAQQLVEAVALATKEAPVTASGGIDTFIFDEIAPLDDKVAGGVIKILSYYNNTPIGEPDPVVTFDEQGGMTQTPVAAPPPSSNTGLVVTAVIAVVALGVFGMLILARK